MTRRPEFDPEKLYLAVEKKKRADNLTWTEVREQAGISPSAKNLFRNLGRTHSERHPKRVLPNVPNVVLILVWLDQTDIAAFLKDRGEA